MIVLSGNADVIGSCVRVATGPEQEFIRIRTNKSIIILNNFFIFVVFHYNFLQILLINKLSINLNKNFSSIAS
jgi:hypothetical protein